jgi:hypothetical protein
VATGQMTKFHYRQRHGMYSSQPYSFSGIHSASYPWGNRGSFPRGKVSQTWCWLFTVILRPRLRMRGFLLPLAQTSPWREAARFIRIISPFMMIPWVTQVHQSGTPTDKLSSVQYSRIQYICIRRSIHGLHNIEWYSNCKWKPEAAVAQSV